MKEYYIELVAHAVNATREQFEAQIDDIAAALVECNGVIDADLGVDLGAREVTFCVSVEAETLDDAASTVNIVARTALHAAGGATPGWESRGIAIPSTEDNNMLEPA